MSETSEERDSAGTKDSGGGWLGRLAAAAQNGLEIARFGGLGEREPQPFEIVAEETHHRLRRYFPDTRTQGRPVALLVPPLMLTAEVWDVAPESSAVRALHQRGVDPWVVDFGSPEAEEGGLERTLTDHVVAVSRAVDAAREATGRDVHLMGYSQGGMFAYQAAAYRRSLGIASLVTFGSPVDLHAALPPILPDDFAIQAIEQFGKLQSALMPSGVPSWATRLGFQLMDPVKTVQQRIDFVRRLYDREALQQREGMRRFMDGEGWVAFPGPALRDAVNDLVAQNRLLQGGLVIDEQTVTLADITCPILIFVGTTDTIAPPPGVRAIRAAAPAAESYQVKLQAGHFGLVVGSRSMEITWPTVADWLDWCEGQGPRPENATLLLDRAPAESASSPVDDLWEGVESAFSLGRDLVGGAAQVLAERVGVLDRLARSVAPQLPRLARLAEIKSDTPISLGLALEEQAQESPDDTFFLFEGRAHSYQAANVRIDNIVRGLLHCGVRQGQHVGLLMQTRPSAVAATVALSRLGAVAVLLRPDVSLARQLEIAPVDHLMADPEHAEGLHEESGRSVLVLGGGGDPRTLAPGLVDMEAIDPDRVWPPDWYTPNPGTAAELAMILITGDDDRIGRTRVTNRRWATSAYGTASACALTPRDTVYCCSPTHHATGILVCVGGALVSGARLAMATRFGPTLEPRGFWEDVRRYGINVVFYSGAMLREIANAEESQRESNHPIRLFAGSGMPKGIWERVLDRFAPAGVVEFFATGEGNAVLVNLTGEKVGCLGRTLPGAAELAVATWDLDAGRLVERQGGFARHAPRGEVGLLVSHVDRERGEVEGRPIRGLFEVGDAWLDTRELVRVDEDGDYWLVDPVADVVHTAGGAVSALRIEDVLSRNVPFVDLAAVVGVRLEGLEAEIPLACVTLRPGAKLDPQGLRETVEAELRPHERPRVVRILSELPMTSGHRLRKRPLRSQGLGLGEAGGETLWLAPGEAGYVPLEADDRDALNRAVREG
ncbi:MAG: alpha/beta fold hydrolase [Myxococcota bacterium]|nr:alpha/beta fold hydrolase [Myxococcota bacterium]